MDTPHTDTKVSTVLQRVGVTVFKGKASCEKSLSFKVLGIQRGGSIAVLHTQRARLERAMF